MIYMVNFYQSKKWFLQSILFPFTLTRSLLVLGGLLAQYLIPTNPQQAHLLIEQGGWFSNVRLIDMWARWDSGWYLSLAKIGYSMGKDVYTTSNLAFFPVYPYLIKFISFFFPTQSVSDTLIISIGIIVSNLFLIASLTILYQLTIKFLKKESIAKLTIWLILIFPSSFFLSSFYTESAFLFFSLLSIWAATKNKWWLACLSAAILGATRLVGLSIGVPLLFMYLDQRKWDIDRIDRSIFWFFLIPTGILSFFSHLYDLTGDFFAAIKVQNSWGKEITNPLTSFLFPTGYWPLITQIDQILMISILITGVSIIRKIPKIWYLGLYSILLIIPTLFTGTIDSTSRFAIVIFPIFIYWASLLDKRKTIIKVLGVSLMCLQLVLFIMFTQFYWVG